MSICSSIAETVTSSKQGQSLPECHLDLGSPLIPDIAASPISPVPSSPVKQHSWFCYQCLNKPLCNLLEYMEFSYFILLVSLLCAT